MRVACVLVTHLRAKVEMSRHRHLKDSPVVVVDGEPSKARALVVDHFPAACGVKEGMTLEEAMSHHTDAVALDADEPLYRRVFRRMVAALQRVGSCVEEADLGTAYVRLDGLEGLYRGEAGAVSALLNAVPAFLNPRVGVADAKFPAFVAARTRPAPGAVRVTDDVEAFLAPHTIDLLPASADLKSELHRAGLHTMGAVAAVSRPMLADRFGPEGAWAWSLCRGIDDAPVVPHEFEEPVVECISLSSHSSIETLLVAVDTLVRRAYARPDVGGRHAGGVHLLCAASGWPAWEKSIRFKQPLRTGERASQAVRMRLESDPPRRPVEEVTLTLSDIEPGDPGRQLSLLQDARGDRLRRLVDADRRLRAMMGGDHALYKIASVAPWHPVPEMRFLQTPIDPSGQDTIRPLLAPRPVEVRADAKGEPLSFRANRHWMEVARIDDRWTFDLWWLPKPITRTYYRIDPGDGRLTTLFRDCSESRWYRQSA